MNNLYIDVQGDYFVQKKSWQMCVGGGHASLALRSDYQKQLSYVHEELGFQYLRFHGLFCDDMKVVTCLSEMMPLPKANQVRTVSFFQIAKVFDYLLSIGMKPFVELSFMPSALAKKKKTLFFYKANISLPKDSDSWDSLIQEFLTFLLNRYGAKEVESWYFEVWNEPDLRNFFDGSKEDYFEFYAHTVRAIKQVDEKIRVGGPATSGSKWITEFRDYCKENQVPYDFISTHQYPGAALGHNTRFGLSQIGSILTLLKEHQGKTLNEFFSKMSDQTEKLRNSTRGILTKKLIKAREEAEDIPLIYTEWNSNSGCGYEGNDEIYTSAFIIKTVMDNKNLADGYSFWTFSDIFEELSFFPEPFSGSFGLLNNEGIEKPSFWAFKLLSELGEERLEVNGKIPNSETLEYAFFKKGTGYQLLLYNQQMPQRPIVDESVEITINVKASRVYGHFIDNSSGNPKKDWQKLGSPKSLSPEQLHSIREQSKVTRRDIVFHETESGISFCCTMGKNAVALFEIIL